MIILAELSPLDPVPGTRQTVRVASANIPEVTALNSQIWRPAISSVAEITTTLFKGDFDGTATVSVGAMDIQIDQVVPAYANARRLVWSGAAVKLWAGNAGQAWPWTQVFEGLVGEQPQASANTITLPLVANLEPFKADILTLTYAGTGGAEGGSDLKGQPKPWLLGRCFNVEPVLIDSINSVFQFSAYGAIQAVTTLYERGSAFSASIGDYANYTALVAATIPPGRWATCLASGMIRLGAPPYGVITADVDGDAPSGTWRRKTGEIITRVATNAGASAWLDSTSLTALDTALAGLSNQGRIGIYLTEQESLLQFAARLAAPCNAQAGVSALGKLFTTRPVLTSPTLTLDAQQRQMPRVTSSSESGVSPPFSLIQMGYAQSWRVHSTDEIAFAAPLVDIGLYDAATTYREGNIVDRPDGSRWLYISTTPTAGNTPPTWPTTSNTWWENYTPPMSPSDIGVEPGATVGATAGTDLFRSDGTTVMTQAEVRTSEGTAAAITGQAATATNSDFSAVTGVTKPADYAGTSGIFTNIANMTITGNTAVKSGGSHGVWDAGLRGSPLYGSAVVSCTPQETGGWYTGLGLDNNTAGVDPAGVKWFLDYSFDGGGGGGYTLYEDGVSRATASFSKTGVKTVSLIYDGARIIAMHDDVVLTTYSTGVPANQLYYPKVLGYHNGSTFRNILYYPFSQNNWSAVGGTARPEDYATSGASVVPNANTLTGWTLTGAGVQRVVGTSSDPALFYLRGNGANGTATSDLIALPANRSKIWAGYKARGSAAPNAAGFVNGGVEFYDAAGGFVSSVTLTTNYPTTSWADRYQEIAVPATAASVKYYVACQANATYTIDVALPNLWLTDPNATIGAQAGTNLFRTDGTTVMTQAEVRTAEGTAAAITGQAATATSSDFSVVTGVTKPADYATLGGNLLQNSSHGSNSNGWTLSGGATRVAQSSGDPGAYIRSQGSGSTNFGSQAYNASLRVDAGQRRIYYGYWQRVSDVANNYTNLGFNCLNAAGSFLGAASLINSTNRGYINGQGNTTVVGAANSWMFVTGSYELPIGTVTLSSISLQGVAVNGQTTDCTGLILSLTDLNADRQAKVASSDVGAAKADNLCVNGDFSDSYNVWGIAAVDLPNVSVAAADANAPGRFRCRMTGARGVNVGMTMNGGVVPVIGGAKLWISGAARASAGSITGDIQQYFVDAVGNYLGTGTGQSGTWQVTPGTSWAAINYSVTAPSNAAYMVATATFGLSGKTGSDWLEFTSIRVGYTARGATVGSVAGTDLFRSDGSTVMTQAEVRTSEGTAAAITGQGALATVSSASWSTQVSSRPTELTDGRVSAGLTSGGVVQTGKAETSSIASAAVSAAGYTSSSTVLNFAAATKTLVLSESFTKAENSSFIHVHTQIPMFGNDSVDAYIYIELWQSGSMQSQRQFQTEIDSNGNTYQAFHWQHIFSGFNAGTYEVRTYVERYTAKTCSTTGTYHMLRQEFKR